MVHELYPDIPLQILQVVVEALLLDIHTAVLLDLQGKILKSVPEQIDGILLVLELLVLDLVVNKLFQLLLELEEVLVNILHFVDQLEFGV